MSVGAIGASIKQIELMKSQGKRLKIKFFSNILESQLSSSFSHMRFQNQDAQTRHEKLKSIRKQNTDHASLAFGL